MKDISVRQCGIMKARHLVVTFLLIAASHAKLKTNVNFEHHISEQSGPIEAWYNEVNNVGDDYEEVEEEKLGKARHHLDEEEEASAVTNSGPKEVLDNEGLETSSEEALLIPSGMMDVDVDLAAKTAFKSLRGDTAEKLHLPEDRRRLVHLVRMLLQPEQLSTITTEFVQGLLEKKTELNVLSREDNELIEIEEGGEGEVGDGKGAEVGEGEDGEGGGEDEGDKGHEEIKEQLGKPQPVLLLLKGWLVHV